MEILFIMLPAFCECLILVGIHSYLGIHVIKRKVIFVDLALAQIAAMGTTIAFLFGIPPSSHFSYLFSLLLTAVGALIFCLCRVKSEKIPQEAVIGLVYAISAACGILIIDKAPEGASHLRHILIGSILWVKWDTIVNAAIIYALIGMFHYVFRSKFILISENPEAAWNSGIKVRLWDFLFYLSFGIIITHSVTTAGVLLVFVFLVAPAIMAIMITNQWRYQLIIGWTMGFFVSALGLCMAYVYDLSTGPAVIAVYGVVLLLMVAIWHNLKCPDHGKALKQTLGIVLLFSAMFAMLWLMAKVLKPSPHHREETGQKCQMASGKTDWQKELDKMLEMDETSLQAHIQNQSDILHLQKLFANTQDQEIQTLIIQRTFELSPLEGGKMLLEFLKTDPPEYFVSNLLQTAREHGKMEFDMNRSWKEQQAFLREWIARMEKQSK